MDFNFESHPSHEPHSHHETSGTMMLLKSDLSALSDSIGHGLRRMDS
jgi:hypothetical protein